jgi:uncharacterized membrane protein
MSTQVTQSITVDRNVSEVYQLWANFENFPKFMEHIESVTKTGDRTSHWAMSGPLGILFSWDVETTTREENEKIAWNSKDKMGDVKTSGQVHFEPVSGDQTEVEVTLKYVPPAGVVGDVAADLIANPEGRLAEDLQNFKEYAETVADLVA